MLKPRARQSKAPAASATSAHDWQKFDRHTAAVSSKSHVDHLADRVSTTPCPRKNYNTVYVAITLANNVGF